MASRTPKRKRGTAKPRQGCRTSSSEGVASNDESSSWEAEAEELRRKAQELRDLRAGLDHRLAWTRETCAKLERNLDIIHARYQEVNQYNLAVCARAVQAPGPT